MATFITLPGSLDDLVFEGRNQTYGAFQLRRAYQRHLGSALFITLLAGAILFLLPVVIRYFFPTAVLAPTIISELTPANPQIYELPRAKPVVPAPVVQPAMTVTPHETIKTRVAPDAAVKPIVETALPPDVGPIGPASPGLANPAGSSAGTSPGTASGADSAKPDAGATPAPMLVAEVMPSFVGGNAALQRYLQKHLRFPAAALAAQLSGRVYITFVVQANGSIGDVTVLKGLGYRTEEAAARVVREMPAWIPGMQSHHSVPVRFTLPITFQYE